MSSDERLDRLGLRHLANDPEALLAELKKGIDAYDAKVAEWRASRDSSPSPTDPRATIPSATGAEVDVRATLPSPPPQPVRDRGGGGLRLEGPEIGEIQIPRGAVTLVGRDASCDAVVTSPLISRTQARFDFRGEQCLVDDAGSTSGTWIDEKQVRGPTPVRAGASVRLGGLLARVYVELPRAEAIDRMLSALGEHIPVPAADLWSLFYLGSEIGRQIELARELDDEEARVAAAKLRGLATALERLASALRGRETAAVDGAARYYEELAIAAAKVLER